jgi:IS30 family transposase
LIEIGRDVCSWYLVDIDADALHSVARELNKRPRKTLQYHSPAEKFAECVAAIG